MGHHVPNSNCPNVTYTAPPQRVQYPHWLTHPQTSKLNDDHECPFLAHVIVRPNANTCVMSCTLLVVWTLEAVYIGRVHPQLSR